SSRKTSTPWSSVSAASTRSTGYTAPPSRASGSARAIWRNGTSPSTVRGRSRSRPSCHRTARRPRWSPRSKLLRRLSDAVDDRLPLAGGLVEPARDGIVVDHHRPVVNADQPGAVKGVAADHPFAGFLRPHLIEDEVAVRVGDQPVFIDLDRLDPVRVVADDEVGAVVDGQVADLPRVVGRDAGTGDGEELVLLAPVEADDDNVRLGTHQVDLSFQLSSVYMRADPVEPEEGELDAADIANL